MYIRWLSGMYEILYILKKIIPVVFKRAVKQMSIIPKVFPMLRDAAY
jgi:hypothetical protein